LSTQQHYDWGLRALKTVLQGCGSALRATRGSQNADKVDEAQLVVQVLRLNILSKLTASDCARLDALLADVFPKVSLLESSTHELDAALIASCAQLQLEVNSKQVYAKTTILTQ
jgi:dynein heavy chain 2